MVVRQIIGSQAGKEATNIPNALRKYPQPLERDDWLTLYSIDINESSLNSISALLISFPPDIGIVGSAPDTLPFASIIASVYSSFRQKNRPTYLGTISNALVATWLNLHPSHGMLENKPVFVIAIKDTHCQDPVIEQCLLNDG